MAIKSMSIHGALRSEGSGVDIRVSGWVRTRRDSKTFSFLEINDGSSLAGLQVVVDETIEGYKHKVASLTTGSSVTVEGTLVDSPGKGQKYELQAISLEVHGKAPEEYPLQKKRHSFEFLRSIAHLRPRTNALGAVARIRSSLSFAVHSFFNERGFQYVHTPLITLNDTEGAGKQFTVTALDPENLPRNSESGIDWQQDFFSGQARLTVSGQLEAEAYALALSKVYTFGPTFRAEHSNTSRHLAEFWMVEPEMAFCDLAGDMDLAEEFVRYLITWALERDAEDLELFNLRVDTSLLDTLRMIAEKPFVRVSYTDAVAILEKNNDRFEFKVSWGSDLQSEHERFLVEQHYNAPVIVYDYPKEIKAFYMKLNEDEKTVRAMDLLVPKGGELIGGSQREDQYDVLLSKIRDQGLDEHEYQWYLDLRKYGGAPHAGFGLGFERLLLLVTGMQNIRDVIPFPRFPGYAAF